MICNCQCCKLHTTVEQVGNLKQPYAALTDEAVSNNLQLISQNCDEPGLSMWIFVFLFFIFYFFTGLQPAQPFNVAVVG